VTDRVPRPSVSLLAELWAPMLLGVSAFVGTAFFAKIWLFGAPWRDRLIDHVVAACAILVAYLLTAATILPAIDDKAIIQRLRSWGYYEFILQYIGRAAWSAGLLLLLSLAVDPLSSSRPATLNFDRFYSSTWWGTFAYSVAAVYVATRVLLKMLRAR
jgi:hypothetical protein